MSPMEPEFDDERVCYNPQQYLHFVCVIVVADAH
jgi:hypothetical protein